VFEITFWNSSYMILNSAHVPIFEILIWHLIFFEIIIENWNLYWQMVACVRDPIDGWGEVQAPLHQVKSTSCTPPSPRGHVGQKRRTYVHDPVGGWGGWRRIPPPTPSEVMPRYDTYNRLPVCAQLPFKKSWLNKQSICTCWPSSLPHRLQLGTYSSEYIIHINPY
jgi:hypothetical protein